MFITASVAGQSSYIYFFPIQQYVIKIVYDNGENEKDKDAIKQIIQSLKFGKNTRPFSELKQYTNYIPNFKVKVLNDWALEWHNSKSNPISAYNKKIKDSVVSFNVQIIKSEKINQTNDQFLKDYKQQVADMNKILSVTDAVMVLNKTNAHYNLNSESKDVIRVDVSTQSKDTKKLLVNDLMYVIRTKDKKYLITIDLSDYNSDKKVQAVAASELTKMLQSFTFNIKK